MSQTKFEFGPDPVTFTVAPEDPDRWIKVSFLPDGVKIGTVLIEDLARVIKPKLIHTEATFETSEVSCEMYVTGEFECEGTAYDLPVYLAINADGNVELLRQSTLKGKKTLG